MKSVYLAEAVETPVDDLQIVRRGLSHEVVKEERLLSQLE